MSTAPAPAPGLVALQQLDMSGCFLVALVVHGVLVIHVYRNPQALQAAQLLAWTAHAICLRVKKACGPRSRTSLSALARNLDVAHEGAAKKVHAQKVLKQYRVVKL